MSSTYAITKPGQPDIARANLYHALAQTLGPPAKMDTTLPGALRAAGAGLPGKIRDGCAATAEKLERVLGVLADREALSVAYANQFLGPFEILASPYASSYLEMEGRLMGTISEEAAQAYSDAGLAPGPGPREAPDHVTLELEFMYFLGHNWITSGEPVWLERQVRFWRSHFRRWLPAFAYALQSAGRHPFYTALGTLLLGWSVHENRTLPEVRDD